ncbi:phospholipid-translocating P-type ATPase [Basidiobolus meristosporus CBS 931.73]|uniref:Phospholipid-transporting ATPase n=1 Tax=Basidiobolus meristosporus CBS 931.73 TaxID=1314790 RepID=A0A1Y1YAM8_9FUNG|nr:phospholipid-translocating P-type ATPase [Basidiobolus meristosporus CBS 931.73]|eukprot:ORX95023.1 phospholipid-translocating P-type ATPase [Basidiobolus meristosporus CBS 931.73]
MPDLRLSDGDGLSLASTQVSSISGDVQIPPKSRPSFHTQHFNNSTSSALDAPHLCGVDTIEPEYEVVFNEPGSHLVEKYNYTTNYIRTTKYTLVTFLPKNLFYQFRRFYNLYFLLGTIFVAIEPSLEPITQILPLLFVIAVTAVKDALEDYKRYKQDKLANSQMYTIVRDGNLEEIICEKIVPGDVLKIHKNEKIPADIMILSTSTDDDTCYVETVELDGETNLKRRMATHGRIQCESPNERLTAFEGRTIVYDRYEQSVEPLGLENLLLRGTVLKNTDYVFGVALYVGSDTKIFRNLKNSRLKFSTMEKKLNKMLLGIFVFNFFLLISSACFEYASSVQPLANVSIYQSVIADFMTFFVIYTYVVPISVFVTVEIVRIAQIVFMSWDNVMRGSNGEGMKPQSSNLNEDLGVVEYIFSDKTGTLTRNIMKLSHWCIGKKLINELDHPGSLLKRMSGLAHSTGHTRDLTYAYCRALILCHEAMLVENAETQETEFESPSPDEVAILSALKENKITLVNRKKNKMTISMLGKRAEFTVLQVLGFDSDRKRMSVIVETKDGIELYCKGADSMILSRLKEGQNVDGVTTALDHFSDSGLRTLVVAWRKLSSSEYDAFRTAYEYAERAISDRQNKIAQACELIERDFLLLGCTAIEDKLQDKVPETIEYLLRCDIKIWLLTGDKQETVIKIGKSSRLLSADMEVIILNGHSESDCRKKIGKIEKFLDNDEADLNALVVNGEALVYILGNDLLIDRFLRISEKCHSVICCRVTPLQKSLVVRIVKKRLRKVTLAIGDGANDVSMIQEAHVGIGIKGMEGAQAVRASDYSFNEFKSLRRLLSVHGRFSHLRIARMIYYSFYKSIALITVQYWFGIQSAWSGQSIYIDVFLTLWNVIFTCVPPIAAAIFDKDIVEEKIAQYPRLYKEVKAGDYWNVKLWIYWGLSSLWHSATVYLIISMLQQNGAMYGDGQVMDMRMQAFLADTMILIIVYAKFSLMVNNWVWPIYSTLLLSLLTYVLFFYIGEFIGFSDQGIFVAMHTMPDYYLAILLGCVLALLPNVMFFYVKRTFWPNDIHIIQEEHVAYPHLDPPPVAEVPQGAISSQLPMSHINRQISLLTI